MRAARGRGDEPAGRDGAPGRARRRMPPGGLRARLRGRARHLHRPARRARARHELPGRDGAHARPLREVLPHDILPALAPQQRRPRGRGHAAGRGHRLRRGHGRHPRPSPAPLAVPPRRPAAARRASYVFGVALIILGGRRGLMNQALGTDIRILGWPGRHPGPGPDPLPARLPHDRERPGHRSTGTSRTARATWARAISRSSARSPLPLVAPGLLKAAVMIFALSMADFATPAVLGGGLAFLAQDALLLVIGAEYDLGMASVLCVFPDAPEPGRASSSTTGGWRARSYVTVTGRGPAAEPRRAVLAVDGPALALTGHRLPGRPAPDGHRRDGRGHAVRRRQQHVHPRALREPPRPPLAGARRSAWPARRPSRWRSAGSCSPTSSRGRGFRGGASSRWSRSLGFALPGTVLGIGYVLAFNEPPLHAHRDLLRSSVINCAAHYLAVAVEAGLGKLAQIDPSLEEASADLGIGRIGDVRPGGAAADGHRVPRRPHLRLREQHADPERHRVPHLARPRAGRVGHLRVRAPWASWGSRSALSLLLIGVVLGGSVDVASGPLARAAAKPGRGVETVARPVLLRLDRLTKRYGLRRGRRRRRRGRSRKASWSRSSARAAAARRRSSAWPAASSARTAAGSGSTGRT